MRPAHAHAVHTGPALDLQQQRQQHSSAAMPRVRPATRLPTRPSCPRACRSWPGGTVRCISTSDLTSPAAAFSRRCLTCRYDACGGMMLVAACMHNPLDAACPPDQHCPCRCGAWAFFRRLQLLSLPARNHGRPPSCCWPRSCPCWACSTGARRLVLLCLSHNLGAGSSFACAAWARKFDAAAHRSAAQ